MTHKHTLIGIQQDLLAMVSKFRGSEKLRFGDDTVAVCISTEHMEALIGVLEADAESLGRIAGGM